MTLILEVEESDFVSRITITGLEHASEGTVRDSTGLAGEPTLLSARRSFGPRSSSGPNWPRKGSPSPASRSEPRRSKANRA